MNLTYKYVYDKTGGEFGSLCPKRPLWWLKNKKSFIAPNPFITILYENQKNIKGLKDIKFCIETGTNIGQTSKCFSNHFEKVFTIELYPHLHNKNYETIKSQCGNIEFLSGQSPVELKKILQSNILF